MYMCIYQYRVRVVYLLCVCVCIYCGICMNHFSRCPGAVNTLMLRSFTDLNDGWKRRTVLPSTLSHLMIQVFEVQQ